VLDHRRHWAAYTCKQNPASVYVTGLYHQEETTQGRVSPDIDLTYTPRQLTRPWSWSSGEQDENASSSTSQKWVPRERKDEEQEDDETSGDHKKLLDGAEAEMKKRQDEDMGEDERERQDTKIKKNRRNLADEVVTHFNPLATMFLQGEEGAIKHLFARDYRFRSERRSRRLDEDDVEVDRRSGMKRDSSTRELKSSSRSGTLSTPISPQGYYALQNTARIAEWREEHRTNSGMKEENYTK
ncbi:unnamed protein product, partial [Amoebophrya sp. A25]